MEFRNEYYFLSNMYPCEIKITFPPNKEIYTFKCVESAFQACKCIERIHEFENLDGYQAKKLGRTVHLREDWEQVKLLIMKKLVTIKFQQHPELRQKLIDISGIITEENTWNDKYWGICKGVGQNNLGKILMEIRDVYTHK
jgi:ribA/ribD-fused uncharacterized protein